jgi:hypothetical protein
MAVQEFTADWNVHRQRRNPKAPHVPGGKPNHLYMHPESGVPKFGFHPDRQLLEELLEDFAFVGTLKLYTIFQHIFKANQPQILTNISLLRHLAGATTLS